MMTTRITAITIAAQLVTMAIAYEAGRRSPHAPIVGAARFDTPVGTPAVLAASVMAIAVLAAYATPLVHWAHRAGTESGRRVYRRAVSSARRRLDRRIAEAKLLSEQRIEGRANVLAVRELSGSLKASDTESFRTRARRAVEQERVTFVAGQLDGVQRVAEQMHRTGETICRADRTPAEKIVALQYAERCWTRRRTTPSCRGGTDAYREPA